MGIDPGFIPGLVNRRPGPFRFRTLLAGRLPYRDGLALQEILLERRRQLNEDILVLLEHPPVITLGRRSRPEHLRLSETELHRRGIDLVEAARGGDVTYHGPGQLVGYPIVDLAARGRDLHRYLRMLEEVLILTLEAFGIEGSRRKGATGVWVGEAKIASIGVGVRRWMTSHGFALNVADDLSGFAAIIPCGLAGVRMISMEQLCSRKVAMRDVEDQVVEAFEQVFSAEGIGFHEY